MCSKAQPCSVVAAPEGGRGEIHGELAAKANVNAGAVKRKAQSADVLNVGYAERTRLVQGRLWNHTVEVCAAKAALSDFFDGLGIAHSKANHCVAAF